MDELNRLRYRLSPPPEVVEWVTFDDSQSRSMLFGEKVHLVPYIKPRGYLAAGRVLSLAFRILRRGRFDRVVSTGSGIALPFLTAGRALGLECHYIESAARTTGPSLSGALVGRLPGTHGYTQHPAWSSPRWSYRGSLFDGYQAVAPPPGSRPPPARRVVVTLGTMRTYGFRRAVDRLHELLPLVCGPQAEVLWQVGGTEVADLGISAPARIPADEMTAAIRAADLVVAHAGIGSALAALDAGRCPVLLPRRVEHGEHVDDHQRLIAQALAERGLAVSRDPADLTVADLLAAMGTRIITDRESAPFELD